MSEKNIVISVVSDIDDSATYGPFENYEEAENVLEQIIDDELFESGDYFFNIHEIESVNDFLNNYK